MWRLTGTAFRKKKKLDKEETDEEEEEEEESKDEAKVEVSAPTPAAAADPAPAASPSAAAAAVAATPASPSASAPAASDTSGFPQFYTLEELQAGCPPGVAPTNKENFLSDADFVKALKMTKDQFAKLPQWKQQSAKKFANIF